MRFSDRITLPYEPFTGTWGSAPRSRRSRRSSPTTGAATWTCPTWRRAPSCISRCSAPSAWFYVGDCHARQGDGELCGVAVEIPATVTLRLDLVKGWSIPGVRLETEDFIMSVGSARPMEDAARMAYRDLVRWLCADYGFDEAEAYFLCTQAGRVRLGNMVDPKYTLGASMLKKYLE